jgi:hypothetical protein
LETSPDTRPYDLLSTRPTRSHHHGHCHRKIPATLRMLVKKIFATLRCWLTSKLLNGLERSSASA